MIKQNSLVTHFTRPLHTGVFDAYKKNSNVIVSGATGHTSKVLVALDFVKSLSGLPGKFLWVVDNAIEKEIICKELNRWGGFAPDTVDAAMYASDAFSQRDSMTQNKRKEAINICSFLSNFVSKKPNFIVVLERLSPLRF